MWQLQNDFFCQVTVWMYFSIGVVLTISFTLMTLSVYTLDTKMISLSWYRESSESTRCCERCDTIQLVTIGFRRMDHGRVVSTLVTAAVPKVVSEILGSPVRNWHQQFAHNWHLSCRARRYVLIFYIQKYIFPWMLSLTVCSTHAVRIIRICSVCIPPKVTIICQTLMWTWWSYPDYNTNTIAPSAKCCVKNCCNG